MKFTQKLRTGIKTKNTVTKCQQLLKQNNTRSCIIFSKTNTHNRQNSSLIRHSLTYDKTIGLKNESGTDTVLLFLDKTCIQENNKTNKVNN